MTASASSDEAPVKESRQPRGAGATAVTPCVVRRRGGEERQATSASTTSAIPVAKVLKPPTRSEERRVGKEFRSRRTPFQLITAALPCSVAAEERRAVRMLELM